MTTNKGGRPVSQPCGTVAAYKRHKRHGEHPCQPCREAYNAQQRTYHQARSSRRGVTQ